MALPSKGICDILTAHGFVFGGMADWAVFIGQLMNSPDRCVCITDSGGRVPDPKWLLDFPSVQIIVRGGPNDYEAASNMMHQIKSLLLGLPSQQINGDQWNQINAASEPSLLGFDQNKRPEFVLNLNLIIEPAVTAFDNREPLP